MKPILFNADMVRALQNGTKTVTRRVVKPQPNADDNDLVIHSVGGGYITATQEPSGELVDLKLPYSPGDILYVRETWNRDPFRYDRFIFEADGYDPNMPWRPSIHMPREAARIFLRVTNVRVEQLYAITGKQARAEGFLTRDAFIRAFLTMYTDCTVKSWVWVIEFERISREEV